MNSFLGKSLLGFAQALLLCVFLPNTSFAQSVDVNPIVITATGIEQSLSNVLPSLTVINRKQIEASQAQSLPDLLQGEPGLEFSRNGGPGQNASFYLRGNQSTNLVIYIDGVRTQVDGYGSLTVLNIPLSTIDRIEVLRGNSSALYGDAAIGGVINIFTRQGSGGPPKAYGSVTVGSYATQEVNVGYGGVVNDTKFNVLFNETSSKGIATLNASQYPNANPNTGAYNSQALNASISKMLTKDFEIGGGIRYFTANATYGDPNAGPLLDGGDGTNSSTTFNVKNISTDINGFAKYNVNKDWTTRLDVVQSQLNNQYYSNANIADLYAQTAVINAQYPGYNPLYGVTNYTTQNIQTLSKWFNTYSIDPNKTATFGIDYAQAGFDNGLGDSMSRNTQGYFVGYTHKFDRLDVQINGRHDQINVNQLNTGYSNQTYNANTGLFGIGYHVTDEFKVTGTTSTGFQAPTAGQIFGYTNAYGANTFNPNLVPQTSYSNEVGVVYSQSSIMTRLVYFNTRTMNAIEGQSVGGGGYEYVNIPYLRNQGYEFTQRANIYGVNLIAAYTNQNPVNVSTGQIPQLLARQFGSVDLNKPFGKYDVGTKVVFSGTRQGNFYPMGAYTGTPVTLNAYQLWSFYAGMKVNDEWTARVRLNNAFNEQYQLVPGYNTMGRNAMFTMTYQQK